MPCFIEHLSEDKDLGALGGHHHLANLGFKSLCIVTDASVGYLPFRERTVTPVKGLALLFPVPVAVLSPRLLSGLLT